MTVALGLAVTAASGCTGVEPDPHQLAEHYFAEANAAAKRGSLTQQEFFRRTQHPDFTGLSCELADLTVELDPALSTLRRDPEFSPGGAGRPRGDVWVVGVEVTTRRDGAVIGHQIGSVHLVFLGERSYGFAPCPS